MVGQDAGGVNLCQWLSIGVAELTCRKNGLNAMFIFCEGYPTLRRAIHVEKQLAS